MASSSFGVVLPGRPVLTDFRPVDASGSKYVTEVPAPAAVSDLTFFLLPGVQLPPGAGVTLYYALPPFTEWTVLGALTAEKPSGVFRTGWSTLEGIERTPVVQLGVSLESLDAIANQELMGSGVEDRRALAHRIAVDVFQYMSSFAQAVPGQQGEVLVLPPRCLEMWLEKFDRKYRLDPSFMFKQQGN